MTEIIQKVPIAANIFYFYFSDKLAEYNWKRHSSELTSDVKAFLSDRRQP